MQNRKPAPFNVVSGDTMGTTWALPEGAIARFGKGDVDEGDVKLSPDGTYFAVGTGMRVMLSYLQMVRILLSGLA
jgi:hypothetical protein